MTRGYNSIDSYNYNDMKKKNNINPMALISKNDFEDKLPKFKNPSSASDNKFDFQYRKAADIDINNTLLNYPSN